MTNEQLRQNAAAMLAFAEGKPVQWAYSGQNEWIDVLNPAWDCERYIYRPKPVPVVRPWSKPDDAPGPVCWMSDDTGTRGDKWMGMVVGFYYYGVRVAGTDIIEVGYDKLDKWKYSTDRKTWLPCTVKEEA